MTEIAVPGEAVEVARAEAQAVLSLVADSERRARLADVVAALATDRLPATTPRRSRSCSS